MSLATLAIEARSLLPRRVEVIERARESFAFGAVEHASAFEFRGLVAQNYGWVVRPRGRGHLTYEIDGRPLAGTLIRLWFYRGNPRVTNLVTVTTLPGETTSVLGRNVDWIDHAIDLGQLGARSGARLEFTVDNRGESEALVLDHLDILRYTSPAVPRLLSNPFASPDAWKPAPSPRRSTVLLMMVAGLGMALAIARLARPGSR